MTSVSDIDLRLLKVFVIIVDCGGLSGAQAELNIGLSTISTHLAALETRLGVRLCERGRTGFWVTNEGVTVYEAAKQLFAAIGDFSSTTIGLKGRLSGVLNIGAVDAIVTNPDLDIMAAIKRFHEVKNSVRVSFELNSRQELERAVLDGRLHLAIGAFAPSMYGLDYKSILQEQHHLYAGAGHPLFHRALAEISREDVSSAPFVARTYMNRQDIERVGSKNPAATVSKMEAQAILILSSCYIGFLPAHFAAQWEKRGELRAIKPEWYSYMSEFSVITRTGVTLTPVTKHFLEGLRPPRAIPHGKARLSSVRSKVLLVRK